ncbi:polysaccharide deacetylase family protein [Mucilaginibacter sp. dw_454]|uniref:polysaccharide deacetylase family protein n=1 Tax=Mucilaginibacter sp. dw_454 TaxID=2720079 RepID=UPI001BD650BB|nr:polysaccharide deacetylase family protein [Mucilaginibacter sp. dw_454]
MDTVQKIKSRLSREYKLFRRDVRYALGLDENFYQNARGSRILIYHGICQKDHTRFNPIFLTERTFEQHLKLYKKYCNVVSLDDYYAGKFNPDKFNICLTFDDGFANNHKYVLPLIERYQMPATFFITGIANDGYDILWNDFLGIVSKFGPQQISCDGEQYYKGQYDHYTSIVNQVTLRDQLRATGFGPKAGMMNELYPLAPFKADPEQTDYWLQITPAQIKELAASPYATIGAHGYYHNDLARISLADALNELTKVKQYLESLLAKPVNSIAFPYGSYNANVINAAKKAGYNQLLAMDFNNSTDSMDDTLRERLTVNPFISPINQLYATITCKYD